MHDLLKFIVCGSAAICLAFSANAERNPQAVKDLLDRIGGTGTSSRIETELDTSLSADGKETFTITASGSKPCIKGSTLSALTTGINWYLNHTAHQNLTWNRLTTKLDALPTPKSAETHSSSAKYRYYLNYCTFSYSMSTWTWERWEQEIDYMALHGINMPLQIIGLDVVWRNLLTKDFGYSTDEADAFIAGPCFQAWWGMNNLEGWGGKNPDWWYQRQEQLAKKILSRMRELGIEPVLPGFCGMVPHDFTSKTGMSAIAQGGWCGFTRPYILNPESDAFRQVAEKYYARLSEVMGTSQYYSMDPFHEGANTSGIANIGNAYKQIYESMNRARSGSQWVIQSWQWSGSQYSVLDNVPNGRLIVLDLFSDGNPHLSSYKNHDVVYCALPNFGGRTGLFGRFNGVINGYFDQKANISTINGIGATPEAIEQVPVLYDALFELPWHTTKPDPQTWMKEYATARYGTANANAARAWELLRNSALNCTSGLQGPHEAVMCARPAWTVNSVSTWGGSTIFYDPDDVTAAAYALLDANLSGENYSYDLTDIVRQSLTDYSYYLLQAIDEARTSDKNAFAKRKTTFLQLMSDLDDLLATNSNFMLGRWTQMARGIADEISGTTNADKDWLEFDNARTLITTWGAQGNSEGGGLRDYSYRQWSGMLRDYYRKRWEMFFAGNSVNWFSHDWAWAHNKSYSYTASPKGDTHAIAEKLLNLYLPRINDQFIRRSMDNTLTGSPIVAYRGEWLKIPALEGFEFKLGDVEGYLPMEIPKSVKLGDVEAVATNSDGTKVKFHVTVRDKVTKPRTITLAVDSDDHGSVRFKDFEGTTVSTAAPEVTVEAIPNEGYSFSHWIVSGAFNDIYANPYTYYGQADLTLKAVFNRADIITLGDVDFTYETAENGSIILTGIAHDDFFNGRVDLGASSKAVIAAKPGVFSGPNYVSSINIPHSFMSFDGVTMCKSLTGDGTQDRILTPDQPIQAGSSWTMVLKVKTDGSSFNQWGSGLLATGANSLASNYDGGIQFYLAKAGTITVKTGSTEHKQLTANVGSEFTLTGIYNADKHTLDLRLVTESGKIQTHTITGCTLQQISEFSSSIPAGMSLEASFFPYSDSVTQMFNSCQHLALFSVEKGHLLFSDNADGYLLNADGTQLIAFPINRLSQLFFRIADSKGNLLTVDPVSTESGEWDAATLTTRFAAKTTTPFTSLWSLICVSSNDFMLQCLNARLIVTETAGLTADKTAQNSVINFQWSANGATPLIAFQFKDSGKWLNEQCGLSATPTYFTLIDTPKISYSESPQVTYIPFEAYPARNIHIIVGLDGNRLITRKTTDLNCPSMPTGGLLISGSCEITPCGYDPRYDCMPEQNSMLTPTTAAVKGLTPGTFYVFDPTTRKFMRSQGTEVSANSAYLPASAFGNPIDADELIVDIFDHESISDMESGSDSTVTYFDILGRPANHGLLIGTDGSKSIK